MTDLHPISFICKRSFRGPMTRPRMHATPACPRAPHPPPPPAGLTVSPLTLLKCFGEAVLTSLVLYLPVP